MKVTLQRSAMTAIGVLIAGACVLAAITLMGSDPIDLSTSEPPAGPSMSDSSSAVVSTEPIELRSEPAGATSEHAVATASLQAPSQVGGDAELLLPASADGVIIIPDLSNGVLKPDLELPPGAPSPVVDIGWDVKDLRVRYDASNDELTVALNSFGVVGDPDGNGDPSLFDIRWEVANIRGTDVADLGVGEGVSFGLDLDSDGSHDLIAGTHFSNRVDDFGIFEFVDPAPDASPLEQPRYGAATGTLAAAPSSPTLNSPDLLFTIANFSTLPGNDDSLDFGINVLAGSRIDGLVGEDSLGDFFVPVPVRLSASIGNYVWSDTNADGLQDDDEPGLEGIRVELFDDAGNLVESTLTDVNGEYGFSVTPGSYSVGFVLLDTDVISPQNAGSNPHKDSNVDPTTNRAPLVLLSPGDVDHTVDAGIIRFRAQPRIEIEAAVNGDNADAPSGPLLPTGSEARFTYAVVNRGNVPLTNVTVTDDLLTGITCPTADLAAGDSMTCSTTARVTAGPTRSVGSVVGTPAGDGAGLEDVTDTDPVNHFGVLAAVQIETATNGIDADEGPGPELTVGDDVTFSYVVTNSGNVELVALVVADDLLGPVCEITSLAPGSSTSCEAVSTVADGAYVNIGSVEGIVAHTVGDRTENVGDTDSSHHVGAAAGPACVADVPGVRMFRGGPVIDETGMIASAGSTIVIVTSEPGASPDQPNEQVYVRVGDDLYGPTPVGLGELSFTVENGGPVTILHHSEVTGDESHPNSVEYVWCGSDVSLPTVHQCDAALSGPRMHRGGVTDWDTGLEASPGSTISLETSEPGDSPDQPHEQVYLQVGDELFGPTPNEHGTTIYTVSEGGRVVVHHYSVFNDDATNANSVEVAVCGSQLQTAR